MEKCPWKRRTIGSVHEEEKDASFSRLPSPYPCLVECEQLSILVLEGLGTLQDVGDTKRTKRHVRETKEIFIEKQSISNLLCTQQRCTAQSKSILQNTKQGSSDTFSWMALTSPGWMCCSKFRILNLSECDLAMLRKRMLKKNRLLPKSLPQQENWLFKQIRHLPSKTFEHGILSGYKHYSEDFAKAKRTNLSPATQDPGMGKLGSTLDLCEERGAAASRTRKPPPTCSCSPTAWHI
ncbi:hypothetical protein HPG69_010252 [Diceros bicornis minor]|uniref:Uncharacterized protein n=1 Tax=Diceros bicornis minor TaxID=77932 RepID=A0A7J7EEH1_DICBM|nr:hypothetical protein HPG69_010252 [Diceros bicornis minor]